MAQWLTNPTRNPKITGSILGLAQWVKALLSGLRILLCRELVLVTDAVWILRCCGCGVGRWLQLGLDP